MGKRVRFLILAILFLVPMVGCSNATVAKLLNPPQQVKDQAHAVADEIAVGQWYSIAPDTQMRIVGMSVADTYIGALGNKIMALPDQHFYILSLEGRFDGSDEESFLFSTAGWSILDGNEKLTESYLFQRQTNAFHGQVDSGNTIKGEVVFLANGIHGIQFYQSTAKSTVGPIKFQLPEPRQQ
jgi:hypothetical protein